MDKGRLIFRPIGAFVTSKILFIKQLGSARRWPC
jgi:hypothetical protein